MIKGDSISLSVGCSRSRLGLTAEPSSKTLGASSWASGGSSGAPTSIENGTNMGSASIPAFRSGAMCGLLCTSQASSCTFPRLTNSMMLPVSHSALMTSTPVTRNQTPRQGYLCVRRDVVLSRCGHLRQGSLGQWLCDTRLHWSMRCHFVLHEWRRIADVPAQESMPMRSAAKV